MQNGERALSVDVTTQWQILQEQVPAPPARLPETMRSDIASGLERLWRKNNKGGTAKLCCMYLRIEKREVYRARLRNSSSLENHLLAVRLLNEAGYQVLLTGDFEIDAATREDFDGALVDAKSLGADNDIYRLFAVTEADIFIGNNGAGEVLAIINEIPSLYLDWFPYSNGRKNSWVYFKAARDKENHMLSGRRLITDFVYDSGASFGTLINNTQDEITDAVACFIEDVKERNKTDPYADIAALIPMDTQFHATGARLSPAWVRRNIPGEDVATKAQA
jgi:putative glycosyltransferase (TIGR04372 family)|tara:strand:- start:453 stop:1286 length:834 start_codon:yes stop_codon:yes gene_type:complete